MTTEQVLLGAWTWEPSVFLGCGALATGYALLVRPLTIRAALFGLGVLTVLIALVSPIDVLGDHYLFSAHMVQHLLLILIAPPLLLLGLPPSLIEGLMRRAPAAHAERLLSRPLVAWTLATLTLWLWHAPALYDLALADPGVHVLQHLSFLVTATMFWWPVLAPERWRRLKPPAGMVYLVGAGLASSVLGIVLTFAPAGFYPFYLHPVDSLGMLSLIRDGWGFSAAIDQQVGGLLMWVVADPIYLLVIIGLLARWYAAERDEDPSAGPGVWHAPEGSPQS